MYGTTVNSECVHRTDRKEIQTVFCWWENKPEVPNESVEFRAFLVVTKELYCNISF